MQHTVLTVQRVEVELDSLKLFVEITSGHFAVPSTQL